jgi:hypothetical protein
MAFRLTTAPIFGSFAVLIGTHLAHAQAPISPVQVRWSDLAAGTVAIERTNSGSVAVIWKAAVQQVAGTAPATPLLVELGVKGSVPQGAKQTFFIRLPAGTKPPAGSDARYLLLLESAAAPPSTPPAAPPAAPPAKKGAREAAAEPAREVVPIDVRPAVRLVLPGSGKYVFTASRDFPFLTKWQLEDASLRLRPEPGVPGSNFSQLVRHERVPLGLVTLVQTTPAPDVSAVVLWAAGDCCTDRIPLELDGLSPWLAGKLTGKLTLPDTQEVDVEVQTRDWVFYPLLVIAGGVVVAWWIKRFFTKGRVLAVLQVQLDDTQVLLKAARDEFAAKARGRAFQGYAIDGAFTAFRLDIERRMRDLRLTAATLDANNADFTALDKDVRSVRQLPEQWKGFGTTLDSLDQLLARVRDLTAPPRPISPRPRLEGAIADMEKGAPFDTIPAFQKKQQDAANLLDSGRQWEALWKLSQQLRSAVTDQALIDTVEEAQRRLWDSFAADVLQTVRQTLAGVNDTLLKSGAGVPAAAGRETVPIASAGIPPPGQALLVVERGDTISLVAALALAVLVGLNTEYFPKPFGSLGDYARVLAWGLSASVGVDLASIALDRIGQSLGTVSSRITRA